MKIDIEKINNLYALYGFERLEEANDYLVFSHSDGYFCNAEILRTNLANDIGDVRKQYEDVGYSVKVSDYTSLDQIHQSLFSGFFSQRNITQKLSNEYQIYSDQQAKKLGCQSYRFIPCKYIGDQNTIEKDAVSHIYSQLFCPGAQLIIVEAAAGYGKTSIAYELIKKLAENPKGTVPIITELSKNRRAQIFKYVLLAEIDSKFRGLSSALVETEIKNGTVPLIIDGFDELLSKSAPSNDSAVTEDTEAAQTMLSTIAELLGDDSKAKIVLTSRKSSIFAGELFAEWANTSLLGCEITRIQIIPPTLSDWLDKEQLSVLKESQINLEYISNPTLLTFLSSKTAEEIRKEYTCIDDILEKYFNILLDREKERQALPLWPKEQISIMKRVAMNMVELNETAFSFDDLKVVLNLALTKSEITAYLERYEFSNGTENIPTEDEFLAKLAHHALLDRIPNTSNLIGFINDFIFGFLMAEEITDVSTTQNIDIEKVVDKYWDLMITAYSVCNAEKRSKLYTLLSDGKVKLTPMMQLNADILLKQHVIHKYSDAYFESIRFAEGTIIDSSTFKNCMFSSCVFIGCQIYSDTFDCCKFYNCQFFSPAIIEAPGKNCGLIFSGCTGEENLRVRANKAPVERTIDENSVFERKVLEQYWRPGSDHADRRRLFDTLFRGNHQQDYANISAAIDRLCVRGLLQRKNNCIELNFSEISKIKEILGR
jgi:hypothetical protein